MTRMTDLHGNMEFDFLFKIKSRIFFIFILLLGNKMSRCAPVLNSTSEVLQNNTDVTFLIQRYEIDPGNTTLTNSSDEFVLSSKHDQFVHLSVPGVNFEDKRLKEMAQTIIQKSSEDAITDSPNNITWESSTSNGNLSTSDYGEVENSRSPIHQSMVENTTSSSDITENQDADLEFQIRQNYTVDHSNSKHTPIVEHSTQIFSKIITDDDPRNYSRTLSGPSSSVTPQSKISQKSTENTTPSLKSISEEISLPSDIQSHQPDEFAYTTAESMSIRIDTSISKQGSTIETDVTSEKNSSNSFPTTRHVPSTLTSLQNTPPSQPENMGNTESGGDEYVDLLHQALVSYGLPDSFSEEEDSVYQPLVVTDEPAKDSTPGGTPMSSSESVSRDMTLSTESFGNITDTVGVDMAAKVQENTKKEFDVKANTKEKEPRDEAGPNLVQNDEQWHSQQTTRDVIELPNGVVIDALFDSIDSLQDQLDICEEGIRQRLVVHKDVFFGNSQSLTETDEEVELPADELAEEDLASPMVTSVPENQQGLAKQTMAQAHEKKPTNFSADYVTHTTTKHAWEDAKDADDDEKHNVTVDDKSVNNNYSTLDNEDNVDNDNNDNIFLMTNSMSLQVDTDLNTAKNKADNDITQEKGRYLENSNHVTDKDQSYYTSVARSVIQRLSKRLKYLEVSIEECNQLTQSMTRHQEPP